LPGSGGMLVPARHSIWAQVALAFIAAAWIPDRRE
jgi:hypothetical protein